MTKSDNTPDWKCYLSPHFVTAKLRQKGVVWCSNMTLRMIYRQMCRPGRYFLSYLREKVTFLVNVHNFLSHKKREPKKVILGVWDYKVIPWSIGDFLVFIETLSVLKLERRADRVDVCVVCDKENPAGNRAYTNITPGNFRYHLFNLLPIINTSPYLGCVFQFDSRAELYSFLDKNTNKYEVYPPIQQQLKETYNFYGGATFREIQDFHKKHGFIPLLTIDDYHLSWAHNLYRAKAEGRLPVAVCLRNRPDGKSRNAPRDAWLEFFDMCKSAFPAIVFVVIGLREEVSPELRNRSNVILSKDQGSTLSDDFALVKTSLLYIGADTGMAMIAVFGDVPYLIFGSPPETTKQMGLEPGANWGFATKQQKLFYSDFPIMPQSLFEEFSRLYRELDTDNWRQQASAYKKPLYSYPSWYYDAKKE